MVVPDVVVPPHGVPTGPLRLSAYAALDAKISTVEATRFFHFIVADLLEVKRDKGNDLKLNTLVARVSVKRLPGRTIVVLYGFPGAACGLARATCLGLNELLGACEQGQDVTVNRAEQINILSLPCVQFIVPVVEQNFGKVLKRRIIG